MPTKEYQEAVTELLNILEYTDEELVKKIPPELVVFWEQNKSEEYVPEIDHNLSLEEMKLKTKTRQLIAMIYTNYLCDSEKKKEIKKLLKDAEEKEKELENIDIFAKDKAERDKLLLEREIERQKRLEEQEDEDLQKIYEDMSMIKEVEPTIFSKIIDKIKKFFRRAIYWYFNITEQINRWDNKKESKEEEV